MERSAQGDEAAALNLPRKSPRSALVIEQISVLTALIPDRPNPLLIGLNALNVLSGNGAAVISWAVADRDLRLEINNSSELQVDKIASELEADRWLSEVAAQTDLSGRRVVFTARICPLLKEADCKSDYETPR
jgi:hypothetical protein